MSLTVLGLMSGTSLDGIDVAILNTNGEQIDQFGPSKTYPFLYDVKQILIKATQSGHPLDFHTRKEVSTIITHAHVEAMKAFLNEFNVQPNLIGFHGQTLFHNPEMRKTCQVGNGTRLAYTFKIPVVYQFRQQDVRAGGQGAPLVPLFHQAVANQYAEKHPWVIVNIGGVSNITWGYGDKLIAGDTGPGCALIDDWCRNKIHEDFDKDGELSLSGQIDFTLIKNWIEDKFFYKSFPKSLDRQHFYSALAEIEAYSVSDGAATLSYFTAAAIAKGISQCPITPQFVWVAGGGRLNKAIIKGLESLLSSRVEPIESIGICGDSVEAEAFAFLAARSWRGLPISLPLTTGCPHPLLGGTIVYP